MIEGEKVILWGFQSLYQTHGLIMPPNGQTYTLHVSVQFSLSGMGRHKIESNGALLLCFCQQEALISEWIIISKCPKDFGRKRFVTTC